MGSASGIVSWNWCAPYYLGCNTICVNGRNSIALASLVIGQELLDSVRNQMWIPLDHSLYLYTMEQFSCCFVVLSRLISFYSVINSSNKKKKKKKKNSSFKKKKKKKKKK